MKPTTRTLLWRLSIIVLLLVAVFLRTANLESTPPGLTHDEASNGFDSAGILEGTHRIYFPSGYGHEPLYDYSVAVTTAMLGRGIFSLRLTTVFWSVLTWALTVALARKWWGRTAALVTGAAMTVSFWALMMSRVGLRAPVLPALLAASALAYAHAIKGKLNKHSIVRYGLSGLCLGLSFYTYMASRGMPLLYIVFLAVLFITQRRIAKRIWQGTLLVVAVALLIGLPLFLHLRANPELETRVGQLAGAITAAFNGQPDALLQNISASLPMLFFRADPQWLYNIAGRPALEPLLAVLFTAGLILAVVTLKQRRSSFALIWLLGGLAPAFLVSEWYNTLHAIAAMPAIFILIGSGTAWLLRKFKALDKKVTWYPTVAVVLAVLFIITGVGTHAAYFKTWAKNPNVNTLYHHHTVALATLIDVYGVPELPMMISTQYPEAPHDPYIMDEVISRDDLNIRYADIRYASFFPQNNVARLYLNSALTQTIDIAIYEVIQPRIVEAVSLKFPSSYTPDSVSGWAWNANASWSNLAGMSNAGVILAPDSTLPVDTDSNAQLPLRFGDIATLDSARASISAKIGGEVKVQTNWIVNQVAPNALVLFTHLIDADDNIIEQVDRLDAPSWQWQTGDRFTQVHTLSVPAYVEAGDYWLAIGIYERDSLQRLPVQDGITRLLLPIKIIR